MFRILLLLIIGAGVAAPVFPQSFPSKPIRLVVGFPPGGSGDFLTRLIADEMSKDLGVAVIADNRPGAGGNMINAPHHAINIAMYKSTNYQEMDFSAICRVAASSSAFPPASAARRILPRCCSNRSRA